MSIPQVISFTVNVGGEQVQVRNVEAREVGTSSSSGSGSSSTLKRMGNAMKEALMGGGVTAKGMIKVAVDGKDYVINRKSIQANNIFGANTPNPDAVAKRVRKHLKQLELGYQATEKDHLLGSGTNVGDIIEDPEIAKKNFEKELNKEINLVVKEQSKREKEQEGTKDKAIALNSQLNKDYDNMDYKTMQKAVKDCTDLLSDLLRNLSDVNVENVKAQPNVISFLIYVETKKPLPHGIDAAQLRNNIDSLRYMGEQGNEERYKLV